MVGFAFALDDWLCDASLDADMTAAPGEGAASEAAPLPGWMCGDFKSTFAVRAPTPRSGDRCGRSAGTGAGTGRARRACRARGALPSQPCHPLAPGD